MTSQLFCSNSVDSATISNFSHICNRFIPISQKVLHSRHRCLEEFSQSSKISVLFKLAIKSCDSLLNLLIFCVWLKSWRNDFLMFEVLELLDQFLDLAFAYCILLLDCLKVVCQEFCSQRRCSRAPSNSSNRLWILLTVPSRQKWLQFWRVTDQLFWN